MLTPSIYPLESVKTQFPVKQRNLPVETGSIRAASTTPHSPPIGDFLGSSQIAPKWRGARALRERQRRLT